MTQWLIRNDRVAVPTLLGYGSYGFRPYAQGVGVIVMSRAVMAAPVI